jgi:hypothetical protein
MDEEIDYSSDDNVAPQQEEEEEGEKMNQTMKMLMLLQTIQKTICHMRKTKTQQNSTKTKLGNVTMTVTMILQRNLEQKRRR